MKSIRIASLVLLIIGVFVSIDLGLNCLALAIPELQDGISYHSLLQSTFGLLDNIGINDSVSFFYGFRNSLWVVFALLVENVALAIYSIYKENNNHTRYFR